ncbi:GntR family transcriptional regulator [Sabulicella rubraurantiaca]|uniref:GntR family transcriptional regulator n=1 Tax=Sabulicella rubraurantiaca TaxID=2811429 RepID=UPI001A976366|nr:GntR family transcriptional regulator [Sabulicella rubraurantiaca]
MIDSSRCGTVALPMDEQEAQFVPDLQRDLPLASTITQRVQEKLREEILAGRMPPGSRIKIADLAARYGLSHMPVREALQALQGEGLVTLSPNRGASVRAVDATLIRNLFGIREALEGHLAAEAAASITPATIATLRKIHEDYDAATREGEVPAMVRLNKALHRVVHCAAGNEEAVRLLDQHAALIGALRIGLGYAPGRPDAIRGEHLALIEALARGDGETARTVQAAHVRAARDDMLALLARQQQAA